MRKIINYPFKITSFCSAFDFEWNNSFSFDGERHDFWETVCVLKGRVEAIEDEKIYILSAGDMIFHAPSEFHRIRSYDNTEPHVLVISFEHEGELPTNLSNGVFSLSMDELSEYGEIFSKIYKWFYEKEENCELLGAEIGALLSSFIIKLSRYYSPKNIPSSNRRSKEYRRIVEIMQAAIYDNLTLNDIASRAAVSKSTVKSLFLALSSISPMKYYSLLQIEKAKELLSEGLSIAEISERMNFSSPNYFCSFFKKYVGFPPIKYKK